MRSPTRRTATDPPAKSRVNSRRKQSKGSNLRVPERGRSVNYLEYSHQNKAREVKTGSKPFSRTALLTILKDLQELILVPRAVGKFVASRKHTAEVSGATLPFPLEISNRRETSQKIFSMISQLTHNGALQLVGGTRAPRADHLLKALCLRNRSNYCYANSVVILLLQLRTKQGDSIFPPAIDRLLMRLNQTSNRHLWDDIGWTSHTQGWQRPSTQHDAAEFCCFLTTKGWFHLASHTGTAAS